MFGLNSKEKKLPKVADFYRGKSIFITGATGFLGSVLLETLLRCCPEIKSIYILLRSKKNIEPERRKEEIFKKMIFKRLKEENQEMIKKVYCITGDISLPNLGIYEDELQILIEEVSIVFHCASIVHFSKPLKYMLLGNVMSLNSIIEISRRLRKCEAIVYTSSTYCNYNYSNVILKEEVYRLVFRAEKFLDALKNKDDEILEELFNQCKPDWPNTYTFSKCLAENLIMDTATDLPIAIIRPSVILGSWKQPIPGYFEENSLVGSVLIAVGKGLLKVVFANPDCIYHFVPVDVAANTHALAACYMGMNRCDSPMIVHCTNPEKNQISATECYKNFTQLARKFPMPQSFTEPADCIIVPYLYLYYMVAAYCHYIPAIVIEGMLKILGKRPRLYDSYRSYDKAVFSSIAVHFHVNKCDRKNFEYLNSLIHPEDKKDMELSEPTLKDLLSKLAEAAPFYDWKKDNKSPSERRNINFWHQVLISCIQSSFIIFFSVIIYWLSSLII